MTTNVWFTRGAFLSLVALLGWIALGGPRAVGQQNQPPLGGAPPQKVGGPAGPFDQGPFAVDRRRSNEVKILAALDEPTEVDFTDQPLQDVIDFLKEKHQIEIQLDKRALEDAGQGSDTPITRNLKSVTLDSALDLMLGELDCTYLIHDEVLLITTQTVAENMLTVKVYPVSDLAKSAGGAPRGGRERANDYQLLADVIRTNIASDSWQCAHQRGPGTISEYPNSGALVVAQTWQIHREIERLLTDLRGARTAETSRN